MEVNNLAYASVVFLLSIGAVWTAGPSPADFAKAREEITKRPEIVYDNTFCREIAKGEDKLACRLKDVPSIGFLVCKWPMYEEKSCKTIITTELGNLLKLREININVVIVDKDPIDSVTCGETTDKTCSGFLEAWIDEADGVFGHVRDYIVEGTVSTLVEIIKQFTTKYGLQATTSDLRKIVDYMQPATENDNYKQICDLQGFFLKTGGFQINDTPEINENIARDGVCWEGEPTTEQVLLSLKYMIEALRPRRELFGYQDEY